MLAISIRLSPLPCNDTVGLLTGTCTQGDPYRHRLSDHGPETVQRALTILGLLQYVGAQDYTQMSKQQAQC